jgi:hypothetical protein
MTPEDHTDNQPPTSGAAPSPHDHLRQYQWKPGQSGNPNGRPKGQSVTSLLRELLGQEHNKKKLAALLAERLLKDALQGKLGHIKEVLDRTEGRVADRVQVEAAQGQGLVINVVRRGEAVPPHNGPQMLMNEETWNEM